MSRDSSPDNRLCADVPDKLIEAWRSGRAIEQTRALAGRFSTAAADHFWNIQCYLESTSKWLVEPPIEDGEVEDRDDRRSFENREASAQVQPDLDSCGLGMGVATASSSKEMHQEADKDQKPITKYLFSDEGPEKGLVKVYIEAKKLQVPGFSEAQVDFREQALTVRIAAKDGQSWILHGHLIGKVLPSECKYNLSVTGHKVSVTLKKASPAEVWHRLMATKQGGSRSPAKPSPGICSLNDFV